MRAHFLLLALAAAGCQPQAPVVREGVMPVEPATDTLRIEIQSASFGAGVLRLVGRAVASGPQTGGWTGAVGAQLELRPPDQTDGSGATPMIAEIVRKPYVFTSAGRHGGFDFGAVTPDLEGYQLVVRWVGAFEHVVRVDSLVDAHRAGG